MKLNVQRYFLAFVCDTHMGYSVDFLERVCKQAKLCITVKAHLFFACLTVKAKDSN